jgi:predicted methyltransferase
VRTILVTLIGTALLAGGCHNVSKLDFSHVSRATHQRPNDVIAALEIPAGARVADLGAGSGYFVPYLADAVGPEGWVYAVEVDEEKVRKLEEIYVTRYSNVEPILGLYEDPLLPDHSVDLVLIVNTFHHIEDASAYFGRLRNDLRPGGRVAVIEPNAELRGTLSLFLHEGHTSSAEAVRISMADAGYAQVQSFDFLPVQIFELFEPVAD